MADIQIRLGKDVLVLTTSIAHQLEAQGSNAERDTALMLMIEPEVIEEMYGFEAQCGVQCAVTPTAQLSPARLAHTGMQATPEALADEALAVVSQASFQHILVEVAPCGLPLDPSSKASLMENRDQYAAFARLFASKEFDAFFLNGFSRIADLKCALMGIAKVSDIPVFASVDVDGEGMLASFGDHGVSVGETIEEAARAASDLGAVAFGFCTDAPLPEVLAIAERMRAVTDLPCLVQIHVNANEQGVLPPYSDIDDIVDASEALRLAGVQFLRACGNAPVSYAGAMVAATEATEVVEVAPRAVGNLDGVQDGDGLDALAERLKKRVNETLQGQ